jgi:hypothetical protein
MRKELDVWRITEDICVGKGVAASNTQFGPGGGTQYYVSPNDRAKLTRGLRRPI